MFASLISISAGISFPILITPIPFSLQPLVVFLTGVLLGWRYGCLSMLIYLALGAVGFPVFAGATGGWAGGSGIIVGLSGGYLMSYPIAALVEGFIAGKKNPSAKIETVKVIGAMLAGLAIIYAGGVMWLSFVSHLSLWTAFLVGGATFIPLDLPKLALAAVIALRLRGSQLRLPTNNVAGYVKSARSSVDTAMLERA